MANVICGNDIHADEAEFFKGLTELCMAHGVIIEVGAVSNGIDKYTGLIFKFGEGVFTHEPRFYPNSRNTFFNRDDIRDGIIVDPS